VKVLVDLAMISAEGQGDMEVEKVLCLNAAATGYAPLIYDLTPEMGFRDFLPLCQAVWRMLDVDPALPRKFVSTLGYQRVDLRATFIDFISLFQALLAEAEMLPRV